MPITIYNSQSQNPNVIFLFVPFPYKIFNNLISKDDFADKIVNINSKINFSVIWNTAHVDINVYILLSFPYIM